MVAERIFAKTEKGRAEVTDRGAGLTARQRTALIMIDGRKPCSVLMQVMAAPVLLPILDELAALGLITLPGPVPATLHAIDPQTMRQVKAMMIGSAEVCLGLLSAEVVRQVEAADEEQLLRALGHWHMAMQASRRGKDIVLNQLESIKSRLSSG